MDKDFKGTLQWGLFLMWDTVAGAGRLGLDTKGSWFFRIFTGFYFMQFENTLFQNKYYYRTVGNKTCQPLIWVRQYVSATKNWTNWCVTPSSWSLQKHMLATADFSDGGHAWTFFVVFFYLRRIVFFRGGSWQFEWKTNTKKKRMHCVAYTLKEGFLGARNCGFFLFFFFFGGGVIF